MNESMFSPEAFVQKPDFQTLKEEKKFDELKGIASDKVDNVFNKMKQNI